MQSQLGEYLKELRVQSDLSLNSISKKIKVRIQFLEKIENDEVIKMPKIIIRSYIINFGNTVSADRNTLLSKFDQLYPEEKILTNSKLPARKNLSKLLIWLMIFALLSISIGIMITQKNHHSKIQTAHFKVLDQRDLDKINYSSPKNLEELLLNSPSPSLNNNNKK